MTYDDLIQHFKTQRAVAETLGLTQPSISDWKERGVPHLRQIQIETITRGKLRADPEAKRPRRKEAA